VAGDITPSFSYGIIAVQMVVYGLGSAVNDSTRLLGGTLGVAVIGSVYASLYVSRLTASLPATMG
jgi:hypothetical protein